MIGEGSKSHFNLFLLEPIILHTETSGIPKNKNQLRDIAFKRAHERETGFFFNLPPPFYKVSQRGCPCQSGRFSLVTPPLWHVTIKPTNQGWTRQPNPLARYQLLKDPYEHEHKVMTDTCINLKTGWAWHATI